MSGSRRGRRVRTGPVIGRLTDDPPRTAYTAGRWQRPSAPSRVRSSSVATICSISPIGASTTVVAGRGHFLLVAGEAGHRQEPPPRRDRPEGRRARVRAMSGGTSRRRIAMSRPHRSSTWLGPCSESPTSRPSDATCSPCATRRSRPNSVHRRQLVQDVVDRILAELSTGPTLLGFEDLQWADELSLEIIAELARRSRDRPLMLCAGYRTDEALPGTPLRDWRSRWSPSGSPRRSGSRRSPRTRPRS